MSLEENKAIARKFVEGWTNPDALDEIVADDYVESDQPQSLDVLKQHVAKHLAGLPDMRIVIEEMVAEGDNVVVCWKGNATHTGEWWGIPATGKEVEWRGMSRLRIVDGKVADQRVHWSFFWMLEQIGAVPPFDEIVKQAQEKQE